MILIVLSVFSPPLHFAAKALMPKLMQLIQHHGLLLIFFSVLLEQIGLPIPAYPVLIVSGALVMSGQCNWFACLLVAMLACLCSDLFWFSAGRRYGKRVLALLCRISLSPDSCVSQTEDKFRRWGPKSLMISKFIPGFNTIAPPIAGASGLARGRFIRFSCAGSLLWAGGGLLLGMVFHRSIDRILDSLSVMGMAALVVIATMFGLFILFKFVERQRFYRSLRMKRVSVDELKQLIEIGAEPVLLDVRSVTAQALDTPIPGALLLTNYPREQVLSDIDKNTPVIVYCSCPNDASAVLVAKELIGKGFTRVQPLKGGLEAWKANLLD
jgi:membrane protein DedA with SNARE-associated domain/rhodanese-related sulfurtransferase